MSILNLTNMQTSVILVVIFLLLSLLSNFTFSLLSRKIYFADNKIYTNIYPSIKQVKLVLFENIFIFHFFKWYIALLLWLFLYVGNYLLFKSTNWEKYVLKSLKLTYSHLTEYQHKKIPCKREKNRLDYKFNWMKAHITSLSFFLSPILLSQFGLIYVGNTPNDRFLHVVFDLAVLIGIASILYWLTYFLCRSRILRYENWRTEHFKDFLIISFFLLLFYIVSIIL